MSNPGIILVCMSTAMLQKCVLYTCACVPLWCMNLHTINHRCSAGATVHGSTSASTDLCKASKLDLQITIQQCQTCNVNTPMCCNMTKPGMWYLLQILKGGKAGQATLALPADEDKLQAAAQLVIGAHAIYDGSVTAISGSQVLLLQLSWHSITTHTQVSQGFNRILSLKLCRGKRHRQNTCASSLSWYIQPASKSIGCGPPGGSCQYLTAHTQCLLTKVIADQLLC